MIVSINQIQNGIIRYVKTEIESKAVNFNKLKINFALEVMPGVIEKLFVEYKDNIFFAPYFDENGNVKLDELYNALKAAANKTGKFTFAGIIFSEDDIMKMYEYIRTS